MVVTHHQAWVDDPQTVRRAIQKLSTSVSLHHVRRVSTSSLSCKTLSEKVIPDIFCVPYTSLRNRWTIELLAKLDPLIEAKLGSNAVEQRHRECLSNTKEDVLRTTVKSAAGNTAQPIFWLTGMAGTGKSTIALPCACLLQSTHTVAGFFFSRGGGQSARAIRLLPTIAYQLAISSRQIQHHITRAIEEDPDIAKAPLNQRLDKLLLQPLRQRRRDARRKQRLLIVIDALDECEDKEEIETIIRLLGNCTDSPALAVSILLVSRPEMAVQNGFRKVPIVML